MKIKGILLASAAAGVVMAPSAQAADMSMPVKAYPAAAPVAASWAGLYIGAHVGGASVRNNLFGQDFNNAAAFVGGGQIGYNWQSGNFVFGLEADGSWLSKQKYLWDNNTGTEYGTQIPWLATARGRFGAAFGNWLVYATAGAAFTDVKAKGCCAPPTGQLSVSKNRVGWTVGGGVEHMLTRNWIVGAEVLYVDFGTTRFTSPGGGSKTTINSAVIGRAKLNYKF